jgi:hypothetical protein
MSNQIPKQEPQSMIAGDAYVWRIEDDAHPANDGWVLSYRLISTSHNINLTTTADGAVHVVDIASAASANFNAGTYTWHRQFTKDGNRKTVATGILKITPNTVSTTSLDGRSHARKMLEAIEAALEGTATANQMHILQVSGLDKSLQQDVGKLLQLRSKYQIEVKREEAAAGIGRGRGNVYVRF